MYSDKQLMEQIDRIMHTQLFGVLATEGIQYPYCTLVGFVALNNCREVVFATLRETRKYHNISRQSKVSILIDDRSNSTSDLMDALALTVIGTASEITGEPFNTYSSLYLEKHPNLKEFIADPNCALIKVDIAKYIMVNNFQNVTEVEIP